MGTNSLTTRIEKFFAKFDPQDLAVFTTFGLDEAVALRLLERVNYPGETVILYDAARRRSPGLLRARFPRAHLAGVILPESGNSCPVFHSKLWMSVEPTRMTIHRLAAHSFNLTRFHLEEGDCHSFESWAFWPNVSLRMPDGLSRLVRRALRSKDCVVPRMSASTVVIDARGNEPAIVESRKPAGKQIPALSNRVRAAAPFVSRSGLGSLVGGKGAFVWRGERREAGRRTALHAKILEAGETLVLGSANLTSQALWGHKGRPVNHETVVLLKRPPCLRLNSLLRGFERLRLEELDDSCEEIPGDLDAADVDAESFLKARRLALAAPREAKLDLLPNPAPGTVSIRLSETTIEGKPVTACPTLALQAHDETGSLLLPLGRAARISLPSSSWRRLARWLLRRQTIFIKGKSKERTAWRRELDWGESWRWALGIPPTKVRLGARPLSVKGQLDNQILHSDFPDVRDLLRRLSATEPCRIKAIRSIDAWIHRYAVSAARSSAHVPAWIERLLDRLSDGLQTGS